MKGMTIGQAADASGISAKMIRHYETTGLLPKATRTNAGYRIYSQRDVEVLRFIHHARRLGFPTVTIRALLSLWLNQHRSSSQVKQLAQGYLLELDERIQALESIKTSLLHLTRHCQGDERPDCPILEGIAEGVDFNSAGPK